MDDIDDQHVNVLGTLQFAVLRGRAYGFNATFKKYFSLSWLSVLLMEGVPGENLTVYHVDNWHKRQ